MMEKTGLFRASPSAGLAPYTFQINKGKRGGPK